MNDSEILYASSKVWDAHWQSGQKNLLQAIVDFFPSDVASMLDVGCGDGKLTDAVANAASVPVVQGFDLSAEALSRCEFPTDQGSADQLPYEDGSFSCVLSTDVLEHLPDDVEEAAWQEIFRVARDWVVVSVPHGENLLVGMTRCSQCGLPFHVNWHHRRYTHESFVDRLPDGWMLQALVLTGEHWVRIHPVEMLYRRAVLDEWSGWENAVCPQCGSGSIEPHSMSPLEPATARLLGKVIYRMPRGALPWYHHSEMLMVIGREGVALESPKPLPADSFELGAMQVRTDRRPESHDLLPFPTHGRYVIGTQVELVFQFPIVGDVGSLRIEWERSAGGSYRVLVEDGRGILYDGSVTVQTEEASTLVFSRFAEAGYYGVIVRMESDAPVQAVSIGQESVQGTLLVPRGGAMHGYHPVQLESDRPSYLHVSEPIWVDQSALVENDSWMLQRIGASEDFEQLLRLLRDALRHSLLALEVEDNARQTHFDEIQDLATMIATLAQEQLEMEESIRDVRRELDRIVSRFNPSS